MKVSESLTEKLGVALSLPLGWVTGSIAFIRQSRMFHPKGLIFRGEVTPVQNDSGVNLEFHPQVMVRMSSAWWKHKEWRDVLGIAIRFSKTDIMTETPLPEDQDLLFATVMHPMLLAVSPLMTEYHDFLNNKFYAVSPFTFQGHEIYFRLNPLPHVESEGLRREKIVHSVLNGDAGYEIQIKEKADWVTIAKMKLNTLVHLNEEQLKFSPFQDGLGIKPVGFVHSLRVGAYYFSQKLRPH